VAQLVDVLDARAGELSGDEAAARLARAAELARERLSDPARALGLLERAFKAAPTLTTLQTTFRLAAELGRATVVAALAQGSCSACRPTTASACGAARAREVAHQPRAGARHRAGVGGAADALACTDEEALLLAKLRAPEDPVGAAELLEEVAARSEGAARGERLLDATRAWLTAGTPERARPLLTLAINEGVDTIEAHRLVMDLIAGRCGCRRSSGCWLSAATPLSKRRRERPCVSSWPRASSAAVTPRALRPAPRPRAVRQAARLGRDRRDRVARSEMRRELAVHWLDAGAQAWQGKELRDRIRGARRSSPSSTTSWAS